MNELKPDAIYKIVSQTGPPHARIFTMAVQIDGDKFEGIGTSIKKAKLAAASKAVLAKLQNVDSSTFCKPLLLNSDSKHEQMRLPQMLADIIGGLVTTKFFELMQDKPQNARCKVFAGIVQTNGQDAEVICVTTGLIYF